MATLTYGPIVDNARGSIAGVTFGQSIGGHTGRAKPRPPNPDLLSQRLKQNYIARAAIVWRGLSAAYQTAWADYAATIAFTNSLGVIYHLSPIAAFVRNYTWWLARGQTNPETHRPYSDGFPFVPTMSFDYNAHNIRMLTPVPPLVTDDIGLISIFNAGPRVKWNTRHLFTTATYADYSSFPLIIATGIDSNLAPNQLIRAHLEYRQMDNDYKLSILQRTYVDFTST